MQYAFNLEKKQEVKMNRVLAKGQQVLLELEGKVIPLKARNISNEYTTTKILNLKHQIYSSRLL